MSLTSYVDDSERQVDPADTFICSSGTKYLLEYKFLWSNSRVLLNWWFSSPPLRNWRYLSAPCLRKCHSLTYTTLYAHSKGAITAFSFPLPFFPTFTILGQQTLAQSLFFMVHELRTISAIFQMVEKHHNKNNIL